MLEATGKVWFKGGEIKHSVSAEATENPWTAYAHEYIDQVRDAPQKKMYLAAKTGTGKSTWFVAAVHALRREKSIRKIWLVEPRRVLRDQTNIPLGVKAQVLQARVPLSRQTNVHILTYGHLQSRLSEIDNEEDIILFDEFHELQGEMILGLHTVKAPIILLSATPVNIPALMDAPMVRPGLNKRFELKIHQVDDSTSVVDMFMEARNRYPEQSKRALIVVPTHKQVKKVIESLTYLKVGRVTPLTKNHRDVAEEGIIVATPYVQTGLDIKLPPILLIVDSGKDMVLDKGQPIFPLPWTTPDVNQQRINRTGRTGPGIVFQPVSAGTGNTVTTYPSPLLFTHKCVAEHFKVPQLTPAPRPIAGTHHFMSINNEVLPELRQQKSVAAVHAISLAGIREPDWPIWYNKIANRQALGDDYREVINFMNIPKWNHVTLLDYDIALQLLHQKRAVSYSIAGTTKWCKPLKPINGEWIEEEHIQSNRTQVFKDTGKLESKYVKIKEQIDALKSSMLSVAKDTQLLDLETTLSNMAW